MRAFAVILLLLTSTHAAAKCAVDAYVVEGVVADISGHPISNAAVVVEWQQGRDVGLQRKESVTGETGSYLVAIPFYTDSGYSFFGDRCNAELKQVTVSVMVNGQSKEQSVGTINKFTVVDFTFGAE